jgi:hypothetical protein
MATCNFDQQLLLDRATELVEPAIRGRFLARIVQIGGRRRGAVWNTDQFIRARRFRGSISSLTPAREGVHP